MSRTAAVIPTLRWPTSLYRLIHTLKNDGVPVFVTDSPFFDHQLHRMWNAGLNWSRAQGFDHVAVLNDDIEILPGTIPMLSAVLDNEASLGCVYPDLQAPAWKLPPDPLTIELTEGSARTGGMTGFCFVFRADMGINFDEGYHWWYGDDAFDEEVRASGLSVGRVVGVPIRHDQSSTLRTKWDEVSPLIELDAQRWEALHGH